MHCRTRLAVLAEEPMRDVVISIRPIFSQAILAGTKTVEYRKRVPRDIEGLFYIYETAPTSGIVGRFKVAEVITDTPAEIWRQTKMMGGIDRARYDAYFAGASCANAILIRNVERYSAPKPLNLLGIYRPPQSYCYVL